MFVSVVLIRTHWVTVFPILMVNIKHTLWPTAHTRRHVHVCAHTPAHTLAPPLPGLGYGAAVTSTPPWFPPRLSQLLPRLPTVKVIRKFAKTWHCPRVRVGGSWFLMQDNRSALSLSRLGPPRTRFLDVVRHSGRPIAPLGATEPFSPLGRRRRRTEETDGLFVTAASRQITWK